MYLQMLPVTAVVGGEEWEWLHNIWLSIWTWLRNATFHVWAWMQRAWANSLAWLKEHVPALLELWGVVTQPLNDNPAVTLLVSGAIFLGPQVLLLPIFLVQLLFYGILTLFGFGLHGIVRGSPAAAYQSLAYGGNTPAGSLFAIFQSIGMKYNAVTLSSWVFASVRLLAGAVFVYMLYVVLH
ncbi:hypothetical protein MIND_00801300 [Mycena indigotica]|uniref:Uncharacterized protein n=1 Tax=Mycena indigotica TaxID=2126181 RepID=A0A8H6W0H8_9AGAR|nr:uncharacterized protein MIND_00801300 [Mycena indigotica]KAF7298546.1 hypothetical protein MIND_00801300 [Mycena indigotica]